MNRIKTFESFVNESLNEAEVTIPWEGNPKHAAKKYGVTIKDTKQDKIDKANGIHVITFSGSKKNLRKLLDEFGGEKTVLATMDAPYGRIQENS